MVKYITYNRKQCKIDELKADIKRDDVDPQIKKIQSEHINSLASLHGFYLDTSSPGLLELLYLIGNKYYSDWLSLYRAPACCPKAGFVRLV